jgi:phosphoribosylamine--glycine ligase
LQDQQIEIDKKPWVTIMAVSKGYPGQYRKNLKISGLKYLEPNEGTLIFQAGTKATENDILTNGGRVLAVSSFGSDIKEAADKSTKVLNTITFEGMYFRKDIGYEF